jgi:hypothetical protein
MPRGHGDVLAGVVPSSTEFPEKEIVKCVRQALML